MGCRAAAVSAVRRLSGRFLSMTYRRGLCPGFRDSGWNGQNGALMNVGNNGYNWSSAVSGINGLNLGFNATWLSTGNTNNRANGFQVRCLQAFTAFRRPAFFNRFFEI